MKKFFGLMILFFITACTALPQQKQDISFFIPQEKTGEEFVNNDFADTAFPDNCTWFALDHVVDGDTLVLGDKTKVRFLGVDTPETVHPDKPIQFCGPEASSWTKKVFNGSGKVCLVFDSISDEKDVYGRRLAYPFTEEGIDITAELIKQGLARGYFYFPFSRKEEFQFYHNTAKNLKKGVWSKQEEQKDCEVIL